MPLALVTGPQQHVGSARTALGRAGFDVITWETATPPPPPGEPFDCYVQLPCGPQPAQELICRIDGLAAVASRLRPTASVLLGVESTTPGPGTLAPDLLAAVALALLEDLGRPTARVAVLPVVDLYRRPELDAAARAVAAQWEMPTPPLVSAP